MSCKLFGIDKLKGISELMKLNRCAKTLMKFIVFSIVKVYTNHKNLTYKSFYTERVMRWRLILEEFSPEH